MPHILYPDTPERPSSGFFINPHKMDPVKAYIKHYENYKYLNFIHNNTKDGREKRQANIEVQTATKKLDYWYKMIKDAGLLKDLTDAKKPIDKLWEGK